jgi:hypothetical protein
MWLVYMIDFFHCDRAGQVRLTAKSQWDAESADESVLSADPLRLIPFTFSTVFW